MSYQDSSADLLGQLDSTVSGSLTMNGSADLLGELDSTASAVQIEGTEVFLTGTLSGSATGSQIQNMPSILVNGTLIGNASSVMYIDGYVAMYGFLKAEINSSAIKPICPDIFVDMIIEEIEALGCVIGENMELKRYRGDTYPLRATLGRNGVFDTTGITFTMTTKIDDGIAYSSTGTIIDPVNGIVEFAFTPDAVATAGEGVYDIQGVDAYIYTYDKGSFILLDDVTK